MSKWGAIAGAAQAGGQALNTWLSFEMEKQKEQRLQSYADQRYQQQRADQQADKASDREYAQGILSEERQYQEGRDAAKHKNALELADHRAKVSATKKNELDARLKYKLDDLAAQREQLMKRLDSDMISETERSSLMDQVNGINNTMQGLLYQSQGGKNQLNPASIDAIVNKIKGSDDAGRQAGIEQIRSAYGDDAVKQIEARLGSPSAGESKQVAPVEKLKVGILSAGQESTQSEQPKGILTAKDEPRTISDLDQSAVLNPALTEGLSTIKTKATEVAQNAKADRSKYKKRGFSNAEVNRARSELIKAINTGSKVSSGTIKRLLEMQANGVELSQDEVKYLSQYAEQ